MIARSNTGRPEAAKHMRIVEDELRNRPDPVRQPLRSTIRSTDIIEAVAHVTGVFVSDIFTDTSTKKAVLVKTVVTICLRDMLKMSFPEMAKAMRVRNHSTFVSRYHRPRTEEVNRLVAHVYERFGMQREGLPQ